MSFLLLLLLNYECELLHLLLAIFQVVRLLAYISDKDLFAELSSRKKLARRLLFDKSANAELSVIRLLLWWLFFSSFF